MMGLESIITKEIIVILLTVAIWLACSIFSYLLIRTSKLRYTKSWTRADRWINLGISFLTTPIGLIFGIIVFFKCGVNIDWDEEVKW